MARVGRVCMAIGLAGAFCARPAAAADATLGAGIESAHVWRGLTLNDTLVFVPDLTVRGLKTHGLSIVVRARGWLNVGDEGGQLPARKLAKLELDAGLELPHGFTLFYSEYLFPSGVGLRQARPGEPTRKDYLSTREVAVSWRGKGWIEPRVTVYRDVGELRDFFTELSLDHTLTLSEQAQLTLGLLGSYAGKRFALDHGGTRAGFHDYDAHSKLTYHPLAGLRFTLQAAYTRTFRDSLPKQPLHFYCGFAASVSY
jgi:hypothetical protein